MVFLKEIDFYLNISSLLSSAKFGKFAPAHKENEKLQKLYKQPVSVDLVVLGTKSSESPTDEPSDNKVTEANITLRGLSDANKLNFNKKIKVTSQDAISAGYEKPEEFKNVVTSQDAIVTMHREMFKDFNDNPKKYLNISGSMINKLFGIDTINLMLYRNHKTPKDGNNWLNVSNITLKEGDDFTVFILQDTTTYKDMYTIITPESVEVEANKKFALEVKGFLTMGNDQPESLKGYVVILSDGKSEYKATSNKDGIVEFEVPSEGEYIATVAQAPESLGKAIIPSTAIVVIKKSANEPVEPKEPSTPSEPAEPKEPSIPSEPAEPANPVETEKPAKPSDVTKPDNIDNAEEFAHPSGVDNAVVKKSETKKSAQTGDTQSLVMTVLLAVVALYSLYYVRKKNL
ncbi:hypothetical protein ACGCUP_02635 [Eubacteriales bacterium KG125]